MECKVTCFERVMNLVKPMQEEQLKEAVEIIQEDSFIDFLNYCVECGCFNDAQLSTLYDGIVMWEDLNGNYWEEDPDKLVALYEAVGITKEVIEQYSEEEEQDGRL